MCIEQCRSFSGGAGGTESEGGDTYAKSGDAYGGDGGDAKSYGGDADASDRAYVNQGNKSSGGGYGKGPDQDNESYVKQGDDEATRGNSEAFGGNGGDADTGNIQFLNGNSVALSLFGGAESEGGDTYAKSGDAYGGDGGDAKSYGGDADASDRAEGPSVQRVQARLRQGP